MDPDVKVDDGKLVCNKQNHHLPIEMIVMDESVPLCDRLLCLKCFKTRRTISRYISIEEAQDLIEEKLHQLNKSQEEKKKEFLHNLYEFSNQIIEIKSRILQQFDEILIISQLWITDIRNMCRKSDINHFVQDLELLTKIVQQENQEDFCLRNQSYSKKIDQIVQKLRKLDDFDNCHKQLKHVFNIKNSQLEEALDQEKKINQQEKVIPHTENINQDLDNKTNISKIQLIQSVKQQEWSYSISFNNQGSIMASGCKNDIKVWKLKKGKLSDNKILKGHNDQIYCLIFSKKYNWFASGSGDKTIRGWKEQGQEWISTKPGKQHTNLVNCLVLNNKEDQLLSCSVDQTIKVWRINCQSNILEYDYTLDKKHKTDIFCVSINESDTALVSCSSDKQIILWIKEQKWIYQQTLIMDDYGFRISFLNDRFIAWQQSHKGIAHMLELKNQQLIKRMDLNIELNQESNDDWLFPTIINKKRQIIVQKHNHYLYFLKMQDDGKLMIVSEPLDCCSKYVYGALVDHGKYLATWNDQTQELKIYNIHYS